MYQYLLQNIQGLQGAQTVQQGATGAYPAALYAGLPPDAAALLLAQQQAQAQQMEGLNMLAMPGVSGQFTGPPTSGAPLPYLSAQMLAAHQASMGSGVGGISSFPQLGVQPAAQSRGAGPAVRTQQQQQQPGPQQHSLSLQQLQKQYKVTSEPAPDTSAPGSPCRALINWPGTFAASPLPWAVFPPEHPAKGMKGLMELRLGAFEVLLAETPEAAEAAVGFLKSRMFDGVVAMDLEWKPDTTRGESNPIALLQLSAAGLVVLLRTLTCGLPAAFRTAVVEDSDVELVVSGWTGDDERKFEESFGLQTFWCKIVELQKVAKACGHTKTGLRNLVQAVLEPTAGMPKSKKLANFDWTQPLPPAQLRYAILDAACTEHVFRCLECRF